MNTAIFKRKEFWGLAILVVAFITGLVLVRRGAYLGGRASVQQGIVTLSWSMTGVKLVPGTTVSIPLRVTTVLPTQIDGVQISLLLNHDLPADIAFIPRGADSNVVLVGQSVHASAEGKRIRFALLSKDPTSPIVLSTSTPFQVGVLRFSVPSSGTLGMSFDAALTKVIQHTSAKEILNSPNSLTLAFSSSTAPPSFTPHPTSNPTALPSATPTSAPTSTPVTSAGKISLRVKFAGVSRDVGVIKSQVSIYLERQQIVGTTLDFSYAGNGVYESKLNFPRSLGAGNWTVLIKGEKHARRAFILSTLTPSLDLTSKVLEPGDLAPQDGLVDGADINRLISIIGRADASSADIKIADLNYDGVVNAADIGLILKTLSTKTDEGL